MYPVHARMWYMSCTVHSAVSAGTCMSDQTSNQFPVNQDYLLSSTCTCTYCMSLHHVHASMSTVQSRILILLQCTLMPGSWLCLSTFSDGRKLHTSRFHSLLTFQLSDMGLIRCIQVCTCAYIACNTYAFGIKPDFPTFEFQNS
jgi:hypothetical protein